MKRTALMALILAAAAAVFAQTDEIEDSPQDTLQTVEEDSIPPDTTDGTAEEAERELQIPSQPTAVLEAFFGALSTGDSLMVSRLVSAEGLEGIDVMLEILKENLESDPEGVMSRLAAAGYTATADEVKRWSPMDYLKRTVVLPIMTSRYSVYEMRIGEFAIGGDRLQVPVLFVTASGVEIPYDAELVRERDGWRICRFMGMRSFP
ncbi:MAG: hypothetical protein R6U39_07195 [Candidatus Aegiribacteria sp.]